MSEEPHEVGVTEISEYIRHNLCERRFKLGYRGRELANQFPFAARFYNPIDPVLQATGEEKETQLVRELTQAGLVHIIQQHYDPSNRECPECGDFVEALNDLEPNQNAFAREVRVHGAIGQFEVSGRIDFLLVYWKDGNP